MTKILFTLFLTCEALRSITLLDAISQVESGGNPYAIGARGERSEYQFMPAVWASYTGSRAYADRSVSRWVAEAHLRFLTNAFRAKHFEPSPRDLAIAWQLGFDGYRRRGFSPSRCSEPTQDRAQRILNLMSAQQPKGQ